MMKRFEMYEDPGHGWLKVPKKLLVEMGIAEEITSYSYQRKGYAYLEEDCDASRFYKKYVELYETSPKIIHHIADKRSRIRWYEDYKPTV